MQNSADPSTSEDDDESQNQFIPDTYDCSELNNDITRIEIITAIKYLKRNKAAGVDHIENDYIIDAADILVPILVDFFNIVLETGRMPDLWLNGTVKPIYKNKGDRKDPSNYRPITILSCLGKLFTRILNTRLSNFLDKNAILSSAQAGFRKHFMTADNIFVLHILSQILKTSKRKLYCAFIDFSKAFDTVWRVGLWSKLQKSCINGRFLILIRNMYNGIKSKVQVNNTSSNYFPCHRGVRQGENLSPLLFSIFLNDLEPYLLSNGCSGVSVDTKGSGNIDITLLLQFMVLLYADDTVIFDSTPQGLQNSLNAFHDYSIANKLHVNISKTKIVIMGGGPSKSAKHKFFYGNKLIEIVDTYTYLGVEFHRNGRFKRGIKTLCDNAQKAMYALLRKARNLNLSLQSMLSLFDTLVVPILTYGSEVWGFENIELIERVHLKFLKLVSGLRNSTPSFMVYGELGRQPIYIKIYKRMITFWHKLTQQHPVTKFSNLIYQFIAIDAKLNLDKYTWLNAIINI